MTAGREKHILIIVDIIAANPILLFEFVFRPFALLSLLAVVVNGGLIFLIVSKGLRVSANRWLTIFLIALVLWGFSEFMDRMSGNPQASSFWGLVGAPGWVFMSTLFLGFTLVYVGKEALLERLLYRFLIFGSGLALLFVVWTSNLITVHDISGFRQVYWGWNGPTGQFFWLFLTWLEINFIISLVLLWRFYHRSSGLIKKQTLFCILALLIPLVIGTLTDGISPIVGIVIPGTAILFTSVMSIIITYAILRYNLFVFNPATFVSNIVATMTEAILVFDKTKTLQFVNEAVEALLGYKKEELVGQNMRKLIPKEKIWDKFEYHIVGPLTQGDTVKSFETEFAGKSGREVAVSFSGSTLKDSSGGLLAFVGVATDIRQIKSLITDVEAERNKLSVALAGIADGVFVVSKDGKISLLNKACEEMLAIKFREVAEAEADKIFRFYEGEEAFSIKDLFSKEPLTKDQVIASKKNVKVVGPKGKEVYVDLVSSGIAENELINLGAIITMHDVSKEVELEEMKLDFVSMAAHELRTPLTSIRGYLSVLQEEISEQLDKDQRSFLDKAFISSSQLAALVENLLSVSRIERGALKVQAERADWSSIVNEIYKNFTNLAAEKNVKLLYTPGAALPPVLVDKFRIGEVISNLIANALAYTKAYGTVEIVTKAERDSVLTQVKDTGQGIPPSALPKLFTKFFRVSGVLEQGSKGTGLGLYISKAIVDMHGGKIWVESTMGKGSTFNFTVPLAKEEPKKIEKEILAVANPVQPKRRIFKKVKK